jgi:hypothetical protein
VKICTEALTKLLEGNGITVSPGQPTVVTLKVDESEGQRIKIMIRKYASDFPGTDSGRTAAGYNAKVSIQITGQGETRPAYSTSFQAQSSPFYEYKVDVNDDVTHKSMTDLMMILINRVELPSYIPPTGSGAIQLPVTRSAAAGE